MISSPQQVAVDLRATVQPVAAVYDRRRLPPPVARATKTIPSLVPKFHLGTLPVFREISFRPNLLLVFSAFLLISPLHADITGTITLLGKPGSVDTSFVAPVSGCGESPVRRTENWKVGPKGELGDVVVWIVDPKFQAITVPPPSAPEIEIKQLGCRYLPHVIAVEGGQPFKIINADPTLHNIRAKVSDGPDKPPGQDVPGFNFGQGRQGQMDDKQLDAGLYTLQCDVHPWMQCWVMALPSHCFGVSQADGTFKVWPGYLMDGDYKIDAWHPRFAQTLEQTLHVKNGTATINFQFDGSKSF